MSVVLGVDVGGTFTDLVHWDGSTLTTGKRSSTPEDQSEGVVAGASGMKRFDRFLHGTTVATNALLEGRGARTAVVTSPGFADIVEIGRQDRPSLYDSFADRAQPLVSRSLRFETGDDGTFVPPPHFGEAEAVAVCLLYGYERAAAEEAVAVAAGDALGSKVPISLSSKVVPEFREYERTVTTVLNAYLSPETSRYLEHLVDRCHASGLPSDVLVMRSSGGLLPIAQAAQLPVAILLSGPAGGVMATASLGNALGRDSLISFDMGGTSTDVCRIERGQPEVSYEREIAGYPCRMPSVAIHTVGAGGGSIAWADSGGALRVGPQSAGAAPGPAAYGRGGDQPTVTDANVVLGRIPAEARLAGDLRLDVAKADAALTALGDALGLDTTTAARGVAAVVEEVMAGAIRKVSLEEGADPRGAVLVAFGGAGGLHATALARRLDMAGVVVPLHAGVFSALGLLMSPPRIDMAQGVLIHRDARADLEPALAALREVADHRFRADLGSGPRTIDVRIDVRYLGQAHELAVPYRPGAGWDVLAADFHVAHAERNGFARPDDPIEVVTIRIAMAGDPALSFEELPALRPHGNPIIGRRRVVASDAEVEATIVARAGLAPGAEIVGPAVIEEREATTYLGPGERAVVHATGALEIEW